MLNGNALEFRQPISKPGDAVTVRAEMDCIVAASACPDDVYPTNGGDSTPRYPAQGRQPSVTFTDAHTNRA